MISIASAPGMTMAQCSVMAWSFNDSCALFLNPISTLFCFEKMDGLSLESRNLSDRPHTLHFHNHSPPVQRNPQTSLG